MADIDRLGPFLDRLERLNVDDLVMLALPEPDPNARQAVLERAIEAAAQAGNGRLQEARAAPGRARDQLLAAFARRSYEPTWFGLNWARSTGRADDRARLIAAVEDAAVAESIADLLDPDDLAALREPFALVSSMSGTAPTSNPRIDDPRARRAVVGMVSVTWLLGLVGAVGPAALAFLAGIASLRRRRRERRG